VTQPDQKKLILSISPVNAWRRSPSSLPRLNETKLWTNRNALLLRDRYKCRYCSFESKPGRGGLHIHHVDRNPRNNRTNNLETVCAMCHLILHAGYASQVVGVLDLYSTSNRTQNEVAQRASDESIKRELRLTGRREFRAEPRYLSELVGFISSRIPAQLSTRLSLDAIYKIERQRLTYSHNTRDGSAKVDTRPDAITR
jgi:hypothetical protein